MLTDITLSVTDLAASSAFYAALGGRTNWYDGIADVWMGDTLLQLWPGEQPSHCWLGFNVPDLPAISSALTGLGMSMEQSYGTITVHDPDGNRVTVRQQRA